MTASPQMPAKWSNYIDGQWITPVTGRSIDLFNPATGEVFGECALAGESDVENAVNAASRAMADEQWSGQHPKERAALLLKIAAAIREMQEDIALAECIDAGKRISSGRGEALKAARYFEYYAGMADKIEGQTIPLGSDYLDYTIREPMGVTAHVIPWNFPIQMTARSLAPALAAGCTAVVKSPELAPTSITYLAKACERAGVPKGVVNILCGLGTEAGAALVKHPEVSLVIFTGSVVTGRAILRATAETITPAVVELGGKSAGIICKDADIDLAVDNTVKGIFSNAGQICSACSRIIVHESVIDQVLSGLDARIARLTVGPGIEDNDLGPVISELQLKKIEKFCEQAASSGAQFASGGAINSGQPGYFFQPTIITGAEPGSQVAVEEVFGPVLVVHTFKEIEEAIEIANSTEYGLVAGVYTQNLSVAHRTAARLQAGQVFVNEWFAGGVETPFGGVKNSGFGREKGQEALLSYVRTKNVGVQL
jgi:acyl-CoA reductase-like NAD-dependent aldehyde dehydrogenase